MEAKQLKKLVKTLRSLGVTRYRTPELELDLAIQPIGYKETAKSKPIDIESDKIPHVVQDLKSVMALSDDDLVNRLFPEPTEDAEDNS